MKKRPEERQLRNNKCKNETERNKDIDNDRNKEPL